MNAQEFDPFQRTTTAGYAAPKSQSGPHDEFYDDDLVFIPPVDESSFRRFSSEPVSQNAVRTDMPVPEQVTRSKSMVEEREEEGEEEEAPADEAVGIEIEESDFNKEKERIKVLERNQVVSVPQVVTKEEEPSDEITKAQEQSVRFAVTLLLCLMVPSAILTVMTAPKYAFLIFVIWVVLGSLFIAFVWFVQYTVMGQNTKKRVIPFIHAVADAIAQEYTRFKEEWMKEFSAIKDGSAEQQPTAEQQKEQQQEQTKPKRRSLVFRVAVRPFLPIVRRRRRRRQQREEAAASSYTQTTPDGTVLV